MSNPQLGRAVRERAIPDGSIGEQDGWRDRYDADLGIKLAGIWTWRPTGATGPSGESCPCAR